MPSAQSTVFETERLIVRTATVEDADLVCELWTDPRVMAYVGFPQGLKITREEIKAQIQRPSEPATLNACNAVNISPTSSGSTFRAKKACVPSSSLSRTRAPEGIT